MTFQFPQKAATFEDWRPQFEQQFQLFLKQLGLVLGDKGEIKAFRVQSHFNPQTYIELGMDGKIARVSNGVVIDNV